MDDAGQRIWGSLFLFGDEDILEARDVATSVNCDVAVVAGYIYARFELKNFDWETATHESRMSAQFQLSSRISGELQASGKNCERLARIVRERVTPLLKHT